MKYKVLIEKVQHYEYLVDAEDGHKAMEIGERMHGAGVEAYNVDAPSFEAIDYSEIKPVATYGAFSIFACGGC